jgi:hypothetical protein
MEVKSQFLLDMRDEVVGSGYLFSARGDSGTTFPH